MIPNETKAARCARAALCYLEEFDNGEAVTLAVADYEKVVALLHGTISALPPADGQPLAGLVRTLPTEGDGGLELLRGAVNCG